MHFQKSLSFLNLASVAAGAGELSTSEKESIILSSFSAPEIRSLAEAYTSGPHLAGKNHSLAEYTRNLFTSYNFDAQIIPYNAFLDYPEQQALTLTYPNGSVWTANLEEDPLEEDPTTESPERIPTFHGYSFNGNASAEYVYCGLGLPTDFAALLELGVKLEGKIAAVRYGGPTRGLKVRNAEAHGMVGVLLFSDPGDDGEVTFANGYEAYPDGPARNPSSVQRGSVLYFSELVGDPTTLGYPSKPGAPRQDRSAWTPGIPSLPVSYREIAPILHVMNGNGFSAAEVGINTWKGGIEGVEYYTGPAKGTELSITNVMEEMYTDLWDVIGVWNGTSADEVVVIGNHRDAWIVGGVADPNGGTAILVQLAKAFNALSEKGWKPRRTIVLASWDGEEYGMVGSTEFVEEYITWLKPTIVAYLNLDLAVSGPNLALRISPDLVDVVSESLKKVDSPVGGGKSLYDEWSKSYAVFGAQSDYTAFIQYTATSAVDIDFTNLNGDPIYHYHSNYDSLHWMDTYGDPGFAYHVAAGQFLGLLSLAMVDREIAPVNVTAFGEALSTYYDTLQTTITASNVSSLDASSLKDAIEVFTDAADEVMRAVAAGDATVNSKLRLFSRPFVEQGGLPRRPFYKNVIYAANYDLGYDPTTFPGITDAVNAGNETQAVEWLGKTVDAVLSSAKVLKA